MFYTFLFLLITLYVSMSQNTTLFLVASLFLYYLIKRLKWFVILPSQYVGSFGRPTPFASSRTWAKAQRTHFLSIPISTAAIDPNTTTSQERVQRTAARRVAPTHATAGLLLEPAWTECCGKLLREIDAQVSRGVLLPPPYICLFLSISLPSLSLMQGMEGEG
jgi:hypothetical protein